MMQTARRDEWGNVARCCLDSYNAGRFAGIAEGLRQADEVAGVWPQAQAITRNAAKSIDVMSARAKADAR